MGEGGFWVANLGSTNVGPLRGRPTVFDEQSRAIGPCGRRTPFRLIHIQQLVLELPSAARSPWETPFPFEERDRLMGSTAWDAGETQRPVFQAVEAHKAKVFATER